MAYPAGSRRSQRRDLPYALSSALRDRAVTTDRYDHSTRAKLQFESELRQAERVLQAKQRVASMWAQRLVVMHGELVADNSALYRHTLIVCALLLIAWRRVTSRRAMDQRPSHTD